MKTITQQREQCGWSQEEAAEACGDPRVWLWQAFENDPRIPFPEYWWDYQKRWEAAYKARMNDRYGWLLGDCEFDSVGPC